MLYQHLTSLGGPLLSAAWRAIAERPAEAGSVGPSPFGLDPAQFGKHPHDAGTVESASLCVRAPAVIEVRLPADLVAGAEFVTAGTLHAETGREGSVQLQVLTTKPGPVTGLQPTAVAETHTAGPWTSNNRGVSQATPVIVAEGSAARRRFEAAFAEFRHWFPPALCYTKIVPVDEVVTLTLCYREDEQLRRLMLDDAQAARLDRLWDELHFVSQDAVEAGRRLRAAVAVCHAGCRPESVRADAAADPGPRGHVPPAASRRRTKATRRGAGICRGRLSAAAEEPETRALSGLYRSLREQELPHDEALPLGARAAVHCTGVSLPGRTPPGRTAGGAPAADRGPIAAQPISDFELATRLSYFLWSSVPDASLRASAASGRLHQDEELRSQTRRMLQDPRVRRLAAEFAAQWVQIYQFDTHDEKSPAAFPTFAGLRGAMYEEFLRFFTDLVQRDGSLLELLQADHTFLNADLAQHYGIAGVTGADWQRVAGLRQHGRGGLLGMAAPLAKQAAPRAPARSCAATGSAKCCWARNRPSRPRACRRFPRPSPPG